VHARRYAAPLFARGPPAVARASMRESSMNEAVQHRPGAREPRLRGVVKFFDSDRGYGFIRRPGLSGVFFHVSDLENAPRVEKP
jgi:hypothetical protein